MDIAAIALVVNMLVNVKALNIATITIAIQVKVMIIHKPNILLCWLWILLGIIINLVKTNLAQLIPFRKLNLFRKE